MRLDSRAQKGTKAKGKDKESRKEELEMGNLGGAMSNRQLFLFAFRGLLKRRIEHSLIQGNKSS